MPLLHRSNALLFSSALIGVSVVSVITFTSLTTLSLRLIQAAVCFAIGIPFLAATIVLLNDERQYARHTVVEVILAVGIIIDGGGVMLMFLHFGTIVGYTFIISSAVAIWLLVIARWLRRRRH